MLHAEIAVGLVGSGLDGGCGQDPGVERAALVAAGADAGVITRLQRCALRVPLPDRTGSRCWFASDAPDTLRKILVIEGTVKRSKEGEPGGAALGARCHHFLPGHRHPRHLGLRERAFYRRAHQRSPFCSFCG
jgi:hypothetical protein